VDEAPSQSYGVSLVCNMGLQCYLPPDTSEHIPPVPQPEAGIWFIYPGLMNGRLSWPTVYPQTIKSYYPRIGLGFAILLIAGDFTTFSDNDKILNYGLNNNLDRSSIRVRAERILFFET